MKENLLEKTTIVALSTPPGMSAIALIRLSGDDAITITNKVFDKDILNAKGYSVHYGSIKNGENAIDDVIATIFRGPKSFTGEDIVEIACHGSTFIQQSIIELLLQNGATMAQAGEFSKRAFFNGKMDLSQTEAIADLIHSTSSAAHQVAMNQMRGGFSNDLKVLREKLIHFASMIELELDFSEEDVEFADRTELHKLVSEVIEHVNKLAQSFKLGNAIKNGVQTVIVGRPNAGKSTLLNGLLNEERAIVSDIPGTTRDTLEESLTINGLEFKLIDTAGIREAKDTIEKLGIERTFEKINQSAIVVYLYDINSATAEEVEKDLSTLNQNASIVVIANKADLSQTHVIENAILVSALKKEGVEEVKTALYNTVVEEGFNLESTIVTNARHYESLIKTKEDLEKVINGINSGLSGDFVAMDIRQALHHLGTITGEISTDELLGNIFANFCIGK
ncbi:tRNA uridine-5-carboxymethylaminomethyl(34) synthesis GTPase MnmE [Flavobacteriales bacterium]|nr:tRNA uridine-5-carboxymethylaminomethyl(34) synthesis GTPase MnmE [Flavobacteriales bacterium]